MSEGGVEAAAGGRTECEINFSKTIYIFSIKIINKNREAAKIFVFVFSRNFREISNFVFPKIFTEFRETRNFAKHDIEIWAKIS